MLTKDLLVSTDIMSILIMKSNRLFAFKYFKH